MLWVAKRQAIKKYDAMSAEDKETLNIVLSPDIVTIAPVEPERERAGCALDGYRLSLPADEYKPVEGVQKRFENDKVVVGYLGVCALVPDMRKEKVTKEPTGESVAAWFTRTEPYQILTDAYNATPKDIRYQNSFDALQKCLLLLLLKTIVQPIGSERLWTRFEANGRKGFLAGDTTCRGIGVELYLAESRLFANVVILPKPWAKMADVYHTIGQIRIEKE